MKAGVDIGTSLTKVAWGLEDGRYQFASTAEWDADVLVKTLREEDGVTDVFLTGNGKQRIDWHEEGFRVSRMAGRQLGSEFIMQANGARRLLPLMDVEADNFLLVSIGTGTSYTFVTKDEIEPFRLGTAVGGGLIMGMSHPDHEPEDIDRLSRPGKVQDLLIDDIVSGAAELPGWATVAHFGKMREHLRSDPQHQLLHGDRYATTMNMVALLVLRDIALLKMIKGEHAPQQAVIIGSTVSRFARLEELIDNHVEKWFPFGIIPPTLVLESGEYAGAVGAYHALAG